MLEIIPYYPSQKQKLNKSEINENECVFVFEPWSPNILPNSDESTENTPSIVQVDSDQRDKHAIGYNKEVFGTPDFMDFVTFTPERKEILGDNKDEIIHFPNNKKDESPNKSDCKPSSIVEPKISAKKPQL